MEENTLYKRHNTDNILIRSVLGGLLNLLNNTLKYEQVWDSNNVETIIVPFFMDLGSSDERMMQDNFTFFGDICNFPKKIDGNFDFFPRGIIRYTGSSIESQNITNRFVQGNFVRNENGKLQSYVSYFYSIPQSVSVDCEIWIDNLVSALKIEQSIKEYFYKNKTYYVLFRGLRIGCCVGFPENYSLDKTVSYQFDSERQIKLTFQLGIETYQPVFDPTVEMRANNKIKAFGFDIDLLKSKGGSNIKLINPISGSSYPKDSPMAIEWNYNSDVNEMLTVSIGYYYNNKYYSIANGIPNQQFYLWNIPEDFTKFVSPAITLCNTNNIQVYRNPNIKILPSMNGIIDKNSFIILDPGTFICSENEMKMQITLDYINDKTGDIEIISDPIYLNIKNGEINMNNPVEMLPIKYLNKVDYKQIKLKISDSAHPEIYDEIDNIVII